MVQIFMLKNPLKQKGLSLAQKLCYFNTSFFWFFGLARIVFFISPLILLFFGLRIFNASLNQMIVFAVPHLAGAYLLSNYLFGRYRHPFYSELYESVQSFYLLPAVFSVLFKPRAPVFKVTPKAVSLGNDFLSHLAAPFYIMLALALAGYGVGVYRWLTVPGIADAIMICLVWNTFNVAMLLGCLGVVWEKRQMRHMHRYPTDEAVQLDLGDGGDLVEARLSDLSLSGAGIRLRTALPELTTQQILLHARDSYRQSYSLPLVVQNQRRQGQYTILGCEFTGTSQTERLATINFVYGDSNRWKFFSQTDAAMPKGYPTGFLLLIKIGIWGTLTNFRGVWPIIAHRLKAETVRMSTPILARLRAWVK